MWDATADRRLPRLWQSISGRVVVIGLWSSCLAVSILRISPHCIQGPSEAACLPAVIGTELSRDRPPRCLLPASRIWGGDRSHCSSQDSRRPQPQSPDRRVHDDTHGKTCSGRRSSLLAGVRSTGRSPQNCRSSSLLLAPVQYGSATWRGWRGALFLPPRPGRQALPLEDRGRYLPSLSSLPPLLTRCPSGLPVSYAVVTGMMHVTRRQRGLSGRSRCTVPWWVGPP